MATRACASMLSCASRASPSDAPARRAAAAAGPRLLRAAGRYEFLTAAVRPARAAWSGGAYARPQRAAVGRGGGDAPRAWRQSTRFATGTARATGRRAARRRPSARGPLELPLKRRAGSGRAGAPSFGGVPGRRARVERQRGMARAAARRASFQVVDAGLLFDPRRPRRGWQGGGNFIEKLIEDAKRRAATPRARRASPSNRRARPRYSRLSVDEAVGDDGGKESTPAAVCGRSP